MLEITKDNIAEYLFSKTELFERNAPIQIEELSGDDSFTEAEGYVNFIFRVRQGGRGYIVKQSRPYLRVGGIAESLPEERNYMEYLSFGLRDDIAGISAPKRYFADRENHVFMMEDLFGEDMRVMRFQLNKGREFPRFAAQAGRFLARSHFYTSELFLDKGLFRKLQIGFANLDMRAVMEDKVLLKSDSDADTPLNRLGMGIWNDPETRLALMEVRDVLIKKAECLVHGDLHTSNIFIDDENFRVIDMEYSFVGPFAFDLGYLLANFVSQYAAFQFNTAFPAQKRNAYQRYLLETIEGVFSAYFKHFSECFERDAKPVYRSAPGYLERILFPEALRQSMGFMAAANLMRVISLSDFPDFDNIKDPAAKFMAQGLSAAIDGYLLRARRAASTPRQIIDGIEEAKRDYLRSV